MSKKLRYVLFWQDDADPFNHRFYRLAGDERELEEAVNQVAVGNVCYRVLTNEEYALLKSEENRLCDMEKEEGGIDGWLRRQRPLNSRAGRITRRRMEKMKRNLVRTNKLYYSTPNGRIYGPHKHLTGNSTGLYGYCGFLYGDCSGLHGDCSHLRGDCSELYGDVTGLQGDCTRIHGYCGGITGDCSGLYGDCSGLRGDCSGLRGDCTGGYGDCSGISGDLDTCEIAYEDRIRGVDIEKLVMRTRR